MRITVWKDDDVSGFERNRAAISLDLGVAASLGQQMKDDDVSGLRQQKTSHDARGGRMKAPGSGKLGIVKQRSIELYGLEDFGQDIHADSTRCVRRVGKLLRTPKQAMCSLACFCQENQTPG